MGGGGGGGEPGEAKPAPAADEGVGGVTRGRVRSRSFSASIASLTPALVVWLAAVGLAATAVRGVGGAAVTGGSGGLAFDSTTKVLCSHTAVSGGGEALHGAVRTDYDCCPEHSC
jgi:hypothetical protein